MKLDRLTIHGFKNLNGVTLDFDEASLQTVILGRNGSGKSNVIEALVLIFRDLDLGLPPAFGYSIQYICNGHRISVESDPERGSRHSIIEVNGERWPFKAFTGTEGRHLRPKYVFGYYSGPTNRLEGHFERHQSNFYRELIDSRVGDLELPLRPLFYARPQHSKFVLLAFFIGGEQETTSELLSEFLDIEDFDSALFVMRRPSWAKRGAESLRFWGARGVVRQFLEDLHEVAMAPLYLRVGKEDRIYLYISSRRALQSLASRYGGRTEFFKVLESTYISDLIEDLRIHVRMRQGRGRLTFSELSEGEQQLVTVHGLLRFTNDEESLFLLDEPDTHLNPNWTIQYLELVNSVVKHEQNSHVIITTHDPLMVGGLLKEQVQILERNGITGAIAAHQPDDDPKGMGVAALLTSELFGLRATIDLATLEELDRLRELQVKDTLTDEELQELERLRTSLDDLDFTRTVRDPLYAPFVKAMFATGAYETLKKSSLTSEEIALQEEISLEIVSELLSKDPR